MGTGGFFLQSKAAGVKLTILSATSAEVRKHEAVPAASYSVFAVRYLIKHRFYHSAQS